MVKLYDIDEKSITFGTSFRDDFDSLDIVELVMELEEEFDVTIPDDEAQNIPTVEDAIRYIQGRWKEAQ